MNEHRPFYRTGYRPEVSRGSERVETSKDADMPRKPLTLVAQLPEFPQLDLAQRRPTAEEKRHTLITIVPRISQLVVVEQSEVLWKVLDHLGNNPSAAPRAGAVGHLGRPLAE
jgi:hypothetical protein